MMLDGSGVRLAGEVKLNELSRMMTAQNAVAISYTSPAHNIVEVHFVEASGNDTFIGGDGLNFLWVAGGHNTLKGGNGTNLFLGMSAGDSIHVGQGLNLIYGPSGRTILPPPGRTPTERLSKYIVPTPHPKSIKVEPP
jgi:hypothetical protein